MAKFAARPRALQKLLAELTEGLQSFVRVAAIVEDTLSLDCKKAIAAFMAQVVKLLLLRVVGRACMGA